MNALRYLKYQNTRKKILAVIFIAVFYLQGFTQVVLKTSYTIQSKQGELYEISPDAKHFASCTTDSSITVSELATNIIQRVLHCKNTPVLLTFSEDGQLLMVADNKGFTQIFKVTTGEKSGFFDARGVTVVAQALNSETNIAITAGANNTIKAWNILTGNEIVTILGPGSDIVSLSIHPKGNSVAAGYKNNEMFVWEIPSGKELQASLTDEQPISKIDYSPAGNYLALAGQLGGISLWNTFSFTLENTLLGHKGAIASISFSPDGNCMVSGGVDGRVILFELKTGRMVFYSTKHLEPITRVAFNPDGKTFMSVASKSDTVKIWDVSHLDIKPKKAITEIDSTQKSQTNPQIVWITENPQQSISLGFSIRFKIQSANQPESMGILVNNERQVSEMFSSWGTADGIDFERIVYLQDGENHIVVQCTYENGLAVSDTLRVLYRQAMAEQLVRTSKNRTVVVYLRENDEYEYKVSGAEGYLFKSDKIKVEELEKPDIEIEVEPLKEDVAIVLNNITFATNSADLNSDSFNELDKVVELLATNPRITIEISAHTDNVGTNSYNMLLSNRRAQSVVNYLTDNNVNPARLVAKGYGPLKPIMGNDTEENRAINRRVEFKIIEVNDQIPGTTKND